MLHPESSVSCHLCHEAINDEGTREPADPSTLELGLRFLHPGLVGLHPSYTLAVRDAGFPGDAPPKDKTRQLLSISRKALATQPFPAAASQRTHVRVQLSG